jgi:hypothetical protein
VSVCNNLPSVPALYAYLDQLNLLDEERLRPGWDTYFMASLREVHRVQLRSEADSADTSLARITPVKLHETPCGRIVGAI